jgi:hypothetical protein
MNDAYIGLGENWLFKADKADPTICFLEASNEALDSDEELVVMKALEKQAESFLKKGLLSYDHLHKLEKNPKYIIGEPLDVKFSKDSRTLVKGRLYKSKEYAQEIMKMMQDKSTRLGASIGGAIVTKSKTYSTRLKRVVPVISDLKWDEVAITYKPVNTETLGKCTYMKFNEFAKSFMFNDEKEILNKNRIKRIVSLRKALMAGSGVNAGAMTGGRALIGESLGRQLVDKGFWKDLYLNIRKGHVYDFASLNKHLGKDATKAEVSAVASIVVANKDRLYPKAV